MHHVRTRILIKQLGNKVEYCKDPARSGGADQATVGFRAVKIVGDEGDMSVYAANKCPHADAFVLQGGTWTLNTKGPATKFANLDGLKILRHTDDDAYEVRCVFRGNLSCTAPIYNVRVRLA
jgi:hypothetical protein